ncbi:hypothetical protein [Sphingomonas soli]|uniref:hypothetical protein n=1 Tax=Sphingomonas soli TaxID=266127 RepID=UPI00082D7E95|nr:hypothetical protein [Sphingomonas soli]
MTASAQLASCTLADSVTALAADAAGTILVTGSHGGVVAAAMALRAGVAGAIFNDAGIGLRRAGVAGLALFEQAGLPAAAVDHRSSRIGEAESTMRGRISCCNSVAEALGVHSGMACSDAACLMARGQGGGARIEIPEERREILDPAAPALILLDSASMVEPGDADAIVVTGSHGGMVGGMTGYAIKAPVRAAIFNDAGFGMGNAGIARLAALDVLGIAAATVDAGSAAIGDARSTYHEGCISAVNQNAAQLGALTGMDCGQFVACIRDAARRSER